MKKNILFAILSILLLLSGCSQKLNNQEMIPIDISHKKIKFDEKLNNSISLITKDLDYEIGKAIMKTLKKLKLYSKQESSNFVLIAKYISHDAPKFGANINVKFSINYSLKNKNNSMIFFDETIQSSYTEKWYSAYLGSTRLKMAYEGSIKNNIDKFVNKLSKIIIRDTRLD